MRTFISVPVQSGDAMYGTLCLVSPFEVAMTTTATWAPEVVARLMAEFADRERRMLDCEDAKDGLAALIHKDPLTRLPNRAYVLESGRIALAGAARDLMDDPRVREVYLGL